MGTGRRRFGVFRRGAYEADQQGWPPRAVGDAQKPDDTAVMPARGSEGNGPFAGLFDQESARIAAPTGESTEDFAVAGNGKDDTAERIRVAASEAERAAPAESEQLREALGQLQQAEARATAIIESSDRRLQEIEERAVAAAERVSATEQELKREGERVDAELAAARRQLEEAHERAAQAERRAMQLELEIRKEGEREREARDEPAEEAEPGEEDWKPELKPVMPSPPEPIPEGMVSLNGAGFDELRELGMSVTQAKRVIRFREERGFTSVEDLKGVPGFPRAFLGEIKGQVVP